MKVTLDKGGAAELILAHRVTTFRKGGGRIVQENSYVSDTSDTGELDDSYKDFHDLGNKSVDITFTATIEHADCDAAILHLLDCDQLYVTDKTLTFETPDGTDRILESGILKGWPAHFIGKRTYHRYSIVGARFITPA